MGAGSDPESEVHRESNPDRSTSGEDSNNSDHRDDHQETTSDTNKHSDNTTSDPDNEHLKKG